MIRGGKRALLLEDNELRGRALQRKIKALGYEVVWVRSYEQAVEALRSARFEFATLDYDLGAAETGLDVACHIVGLPVPTRPERIAIHSNHDEGAALMLEAFKVAGVDADREEI